MGTWRCSNAFGRLRPRPARRARRSCWAEALAINSGVVEIRYNIGVNVRLEGPAVFEVDGLNTGLLWSAR